MLPGGLEQAVVAFAGSSGRAALPWRVDRDPWAVLVSEVMLAQTQVARVEGPFRAFLWRFPAPAACAGAPLGDVLRSWQGLGYNRRAVGLHRTAVRIRDEHGGDVPATLAELTALPGVGPYTARAVLTFAFRTDAAPVDTNIARVLARAVAGAPLSRSAAQLLADRLLPAGRGTAWNEGLMDLGATLCTAAQPRCDACPLAAVRLCVWHAAGSPAPDPARGGVGARRGQGRFEGSDRQRRGRLVTAACSAPVPRDEVPLVAGCPEDQELALRIAADLVGEGLLAWTEEGDLVPA